MRPITMRLCGWGPYKEEQNIDFEKLSGRGLFLITGDTGAGKTTIFDAITYALFGDMSGQVREKGSVRSDFADENTPTYVELTMRHRGAVYHIRRSPEYMRPKKKKTGDASLVKEKETALLTMPEGEIIEGSSAVSRRIQEITGMDLRQFRQISMIAQGEFARLLTAAPKEKTQIFREIFGTELYQRFALRLRQRAQELHGRLQIVTHKMEEDIAGFPCQEEEWRALAAEGASLPEEVCRYLQEKARTEQKETVRLAEALTQTENNLEQVNAACAEVSRLGRLLEEIRGLTQEAAKAALPYEKKEALNAWLTLAGEYLAGEAAVRNTEKEAGEAQKKLEKSRAAYREAEAAAEQKHQAYEHAQRIYRRAVIGIAASMVEEGKPCPVCGSLEHPAVAQAASDVPDEKELERLQKEDTAASRHLTECYGSAAAGRQEAQRQKQLLAESREKLLTLQKRCEEAKQDCGGALTELFSVCGIREADAAGLTEQLLHRMESALEQLLAAYHRADTLLLEKKSALAEGLLKLGIAKEELLQEKEQLLSDKRSGLLQEKSRILEAQRKNYALLENALRVERALREKLSVMEKLKQSYGLVKDLDNLTWGANPKKLVFEQYVLAGYFEEILQAANKRLAGMTSGRYALYRVEEIGDGRIRDSLEIRVLDYYTGRYRSVKTLSGGETFKASLSLALGLSDVIQREGGGISVDCLFIDEGFGALDTESLEQACRILKTLVSGECMIGIISHVPELKEQIDNRLVIRRTSHGSSVEQA